MGTLPLLIRPTWTRSGGIRFPWRRLAGSLGFSSLVGEDGMSQNALLRSGKGLGIPGTARKEDRKTKLTVAAPAPVEDRQDHFAVRNGVRCAGVHLIVDLYEAQHLDDIDHIEATLRRCVAGGKRDAPAYPSASLPAERRIRRRRAGREPHLHPHVAGSGLRRARRVHVRLAPIPTRAFRCCARRSRQSAWA